ncbi:hypothetical protein ACP4OV_001339 [Aristida adscensionis]
MDSEAEITGPLLAAAGNGGGAAAAAVEEAVPTWREQMTARGIGVSAVLGVLFCLITHKLNLTVGITPSLNVAAGLLGYFLVRTWTAALEKLGVVSTPFTKQENTVILTCVVACYGLAATAGGAAMLAMNQKTYELIGPDYPGNRPEDVKNPGLGWMICFMFVVSFLGLFSLLALRKVMVIDYKLTYPSGTATATMINSFHTKKGAKIANKKVNCLGKYLGISFFWNCFKWFFSGVGDSCGFDNFPLLGLTAFKNSLYFDFSPTYIGCGLITSHAVNCSTLLGAIISWGFLWPYISTKAGSWYPANLGRNDFKGLYGYKVFISLSLILGDGLYNLIKIMYTTIKEILNKRSNQGRLALFTHIEGDEGPKLSAEEKLQNETFVKDNIPSWVAGYGYVGLAAVSTATVPMIFPQLRWYLVLSSYVVAPLLAFCNTYGAGLTDWSLASTYGKVGLFVFAAWVGEEGGGVIAGLSACAVMMSILSTAADLMQDFRTGYLTLSSPRSMFMAQLIGTAMGCVLAPLTFWLYWTTFDVGDPEGMFKAPYAVIYREMAILGVVGLSALPQYCLAFCGFFFVATIVTNIVRDVAPKEVSRYMPLPMAMAIPFYIGAYFAIDMFVGTAILYVWEKVDKKEAKEYAGAVASGLICGDGIWSVPSAILSILRINPPICMFFKPSLAN